jgi:hypothetical protein
MCRQLTDLKPISLGIIAFEKIDCDFFYVIKTLLSVLLAKDVPNSPKVNLKDLNECQKPIEILFIVF